MKMKNGTIAICLMAVLLISLVGCTSESGGDDDEKVTITVTRVEKRTIDGYGMEPDDNHTFIVVEFTIKNGVDSTIYISALWFALEHPGGWSHYAEWSLLGGDADTELEKGESGDFFVGFEVPDNETVSTSWKLTYTQLFFGAEANLVNIVDGIHNPTYVVLTIDSYHYAQQDDDGLNASANHTFLYANITLENTGETMNNFTTGGGYFDLYLVGDPIHEYYDGEDDAKPDQVEPSESVSWYIYWEISEEATPEKIVYDPFMDPGTEAMFA